MALFPNILSPLAPLAFVPLLLFGPPRLTVVADAPGQPVVIRATHAGEADHVDMAVRVIQRENGRLAEHAATLTEQRTRSADERVFAFDPGSVRGTATVVVIRGTHGEDGPFMEAMVQLDARGAIVGIAYSQRASMLGGATFPPFSARDVESALRAVETRGVSLR